MAVVPLVREGVYLELIALPCTADRYSMPLGVKVLGGRGFFRVYRGAGLLRALERGVECMLLLSPVDPRLFIESVLHTFEHALPWNGPPLVDERLGFWYACSSILPFSSVGDEYHYSCELRPLGGTVPVAYTRGYGCVVEALVYATKARAGIADPRGDLLNYFVSCVRRSGDEQLASALERALHALLGNLLESARP